VIFFTRTDQIKENCANEIRKLNGTWKVTISQPRRTNSQNAYFHALLAIISPVAGYTPEDLKEVLKAELIGMREITYNGKTYLLPIPSSSLDKQQYGVLLDKVLQLANFLGVSVPAKGYYGL